MAKNLFSLADAYNKLRDDLVVIYTNHVEEFVDTYGDKKSKVKTIGKLIDSVITLEGLFTIVLYTKLEKTKEGMEYIFSTQNDGTNTAKSPKSMLPAKMPNNLRLVIEQMNEYYK